MRFQGVFRNGNILPGTIQFNATFINSRRKKAENPRNDELRFFRLRPSRNISTFGIFFVKLSHLICSGKSAFENAIFLRQVVFFDNLNSKNGCLNEFQDNKEK